MKLNMRATSRATTGFAVEIGEVRVDLGGGRMVVAGADMAVARERAALAPHHLRELGVRLQLHEAEHHLRAGPLEVAGPADIGLLVEARLELDQRGHRFAGLGGLGERLDDRRVPREVRIKRLLDGDDVRVARRLLQELHHHVEGS